MTEQKETRVYLIDTEEYRGDLDLLSISDEQFMDIAEELGSVYSLKGFEKAFNEYDLFAFGDSSRISPVYSYIRII